MHTPSTNKKAFTLIELLTVIAIIGILAAILIPTVGKVRASAKQAGCKSHLRQIGMACLLYSEDNKGFFPPPKVPSNPVLQNNWMFFIMPYAAPKAKEAATWDQFIAQIKKGVLACPANNVDASGAGYVQAWISYKFAYSFYTQGQNVVLPYAYAPGSVTKAMAKSRLIAPSRTFMVADGWQGDTAFQSYNDANLDAGIRTSVHGGNANILFADGHVDTLSAAALQERWPTAYVKITD